MKLNFSNLLALITVVLTLSVVSTASAQEGSQSNDFPELGPPYQDANAREDKPLLYEPENGKAQKEQIVNTPSTTSPKQKEKVLDNQKSTSAKPEADALSFNFLYYIFQKFKTSDIVDK